MLRHSKHGAVGISALIAVFCLLSSFYAWSQNTNPNSSKLDSVVDKNAMYVIDGIPSANKLNDINVNDILSIDVLKKEKLTDLSLNPQNDVVIVVTKKGAKESYQKKFSAFSKKYTVNISKQKGKDDSCNYIVNGNVLSNSNVKTEQLYNIKSTEIKSIDIMENPWYNGGESRIYLVVIRTKN